MHTIQEQIDALGPGGGKVILPCGDFRSQGQIILPSAVTLIGQGYPTVIAGIRPFNNNARQYMCSVRDLRVEAVPGVADYIGIDFRRISSSSIKDVMISGFKTGALLAFESYYNYLESIFTDCSVDGIEIYSGANQNTIQNCKPSAPIAIQIINSNGTTILGGSGEGATPGNFIKQVGADSVGTAVKNFRGESAGWGPVWCNTDNLVGSF